MSQPNPKAEQQEAYEQLRRDTFIEAGLVYSGKNEEGEDEFIGTEAQWHEYETLLDEKLNEF